MTEIVLNRALRCRLCGSDWMGGRCAYCGHDRFVDMTGYFPDGPQSTPEAAWYPAAVAEAEGERTQSS